MNRLAGRISVVNSKHQDSLASYLVLVTGTFCALANLKIKKGGVCWLVNICKSKVVKFDHFKKLTKK